ncbi:hypothetical protein N7U66_18290 [Lacinutrix neustonica]|uniref:Uncharacterized protein n=1 Tax=Lacinutrix neustonica TaxID=2980107 RepID=A0A9E8MVQ3_9FLAO|nr:hypothetical protein [Lacinutrix neustonica]WAC01809.1 hypothetical protein N7U66_18290 [Lacinutrix neustonica]
MNQKTNKVICGLVFCFLVMQISVGQTYSSEDPNTNETVTLNGTNVSEGVFNSFFDTNSAPTTRPGSAVFLTQIGEDNNARVQVVAQASDINIVQNGNDNDVNLKYQVKSVFTDLYQNGNNNYITDYSIETNQDISLNLKQNGDNLNFERFGTNEISKNIKFTQTAASPTIIIRSFK